ncbi:hypothetical protein CC86DRAFT_408585 [Ophiobolus disseminans]|uniref:Piwi domain-containing protein n=1 Tax=Ophiobolus disseminans TaxID=1469910 RepID=A0A6A6ZV91_9PLEO|nr:hypothetical protein CC86DRAFT_408585 [Ophiobolus disseminans]
MTDSGSSNADSGHTSARGTSRHRHAAVVDIETPALGMKAIKMDKPHSKTAIWRFFQQVKELPLLCVVVFEMRTTSSGVQKPTINREHRQLAADKWLQTHMSYYQGRITVDVGRLLGVVRMIFCVADEAEETTLRLRFQNTTDTRPVEIVSQRGPRKIRWTITGHEDPKDADYENRLNAILPPLDINNIFDPLLPGCNKKPDAIQPQDYKYHVRYQVSVNVSSRQINVGADVVPCMPSKPLIDVVYNIIGQTGVESPDETLLSGWLPKIKRRLIGATVRCGYIPKTGTTASANILTVDEIGEGRCFQIRDIQMPQHPNIDLVTLNNSTVAVYDYFQQNVLPSSKSLNRYLPLVQVDRKSWISLELLYVDSHQFLRRYGHLNNVMHDKTQLSLMHEGYPEIFNWSTSLMNNLISHGPKDARGNPQSSFKISGPAELRLSARLLADEKTGIDRAFRATTPLHKSTKQVIPRNSRISIIYVQTLIDMDVDDVLVRKVRHALASHASVSDIKCVKPRLDRTKVRIDGIVPDCDLAFAIVDDSRQTKDHTNQTVSRLHELVDCIKGFLLACAKRSYLTRRFNRPLEPNLRYLPRSIRAKINYKLGRTNYDTDLAHLVSGTGLMIAGGHTAHRTSATEYCGSVFVDRRNQRRCLPSIPWLKSRKVNNGMIGIKKMMIERFEKCNARPEKLLFCNDSMKFDDKSSSFEYDLRQVKAEYKKVFGRQHDKISITYVVVNKHTAIKIVPTENAGKGMVPLFNYTVNDERTAKYRYYVVKNEPYWSEEDLQTLTRHINASSQISTTDEPRSKCLPLSFASKLCRRTYDYYVLDAPMPAMQRHKRITREVKDKEWTREYTIVSDVRKDLGIVDTRGEPDPDNEGETLPRMRLLP